jgi:hypothetical protein
MKGKRGNLVEQVLIHIILIALLFALFFMANAGKINARGLKQQMIEKQTALIIEASEPGFIYEIEKFNEDGFIDDMAIKQGRVYAKVNGLTSAKGYPFSSPYSVTLEKKDYKFVIKIE